MPPKKEKPAVFTKEHFNETIGFLIFLILLGALWSQFSGQAENLAAYGSIWDAIVAFCLRIWRVLRVLAAFIIGLSVWWAVYSRVKLHNLAKAEQEIYGSEVPAALGAETAKPLAEKNDKWVRVIEHLNSTNPSDWRLAIIEADVMLDELLTANRYHGDSVGEKLKSVEPGDMKTLDAAWEAHKVRNRIAHSGSDFELTEREAKRVIALFESVFKEYQII
jgi:hypothetical protein